LQQGFSSIDETIRRRRDLLRLQHGGIVRMNINEPKSNRVLPLLMGASNFSFLVYL
jgi:hypothetical protein